MAYDRMVAPMFSLPTLILGCLLLAIPTRGQLGPDSRWLNPNGTKPDFSSAFTNGDQITLSWLALNNSVSDLWVTSYDVQTDNFAQLITTGINITNRGTYKWRININATEISIDSRFVFRFVPTGIQYYTLLFQQIASPGFSLASQVISTTSSSSTSTPSSTTSPTASATQSPFSQYSNGPTSVPTAGIAIGVVFGVVALVAFVFWLRWWIRRRRSSDPPAPAPEVETAEPMMPTRQAENSDRPPRLELTGDEILPVELDGPSGSRKLPGQHELYA